MPSVYPHHRSPAQTRKYWPGVHRHTFPHFFIELDEAVIFVHSHLGQRKHNACEDVNDNLLSDGALDAPAKNSVATNEACNECVGLEFFASWRSPLEEEHSSLVDESESRKVPCMLSRGT